MPGSRVLARQKEFDETEVLDAATELFWRQGYKATSVRDLTTHTGLGEGSLYNAFGGKKGLFQAALKRYRGRLSRWLRRIDDFDSPRAGLEWFIGGIAKGLCGQADLRGCLITNTTIELAPHDAEIQQELRSIYSEVENALCRTIKRAQNHGEVSLHRPARKLARFLTLNLEGLRVLAKSKPGPRALRDMANMSLSILFEEERPARHAKAQALGAGA